MSEGVVVWITGLPSSGKSTLAARLAVSLRLRGSATVELDGDAVRGCIVPSPGYGERGRRDFYETLARTAALIARQGFVVVVPATATRAAFRARARQLWPRFVEVFVDVPLAICAERDTKGLYAAKTRDLPGLKIPYERPVCPEVTVQGAESGDIEQVVRAIDVLGEYPAEISVSGCG